MELVLMLASTAIVLISALLGHVLGFYAGYKKGSHVMSDTIATEMIQWAKVRFGSQEEAMKEMRSLSDFMKGNNND